MFLFIISNLNIQNEYNTTAPGVTCLNMAVVTIELLYYMQPEEELQPLKDELFGEDSLMLLHSFLLVELDKKQLNKSHAYLQSERDGKNLWGT